MLIMYRGAVLGTVAKTLKKKIKLWFASLTDLTVVSRFVLPSERKTLSLWNVLGWNKRNCRGAGAVLVPRVCACAVPRKCHVRAPWRERRRGRAPRSDRALTRPRGPHTGSGGTGRAAGPGHRPRPGRAPGEAPRRARDGGAAGEGAAGGNGASALVS